MSAAERVRKLAALAGSDNEFEANEAARQACRIIREGKVVLEDADPARSARRAAEQHARGWSSVPEWWTSPPAPPPSSSAGRPAARSRKPPPRGPFVRKPDAFAGTCVACNEVIERGDAFSCPDGFVHGDCIPAGQRP